MTDLINAGDTKIEYCPTPDMIGDCFTNTIQGSLFLKFRNLILGIDEVDITMYNTKAIKRINE